MSCGSASCASRLRFAFRTLGRFEIRRGAYTVDPSRWERKVAERVVRLLLIRGGELVSEDELLEAFWPDKPPGSARRGLQTAISSARAVLDLPWEETRLRAHDRSYALVLHDGDQVDAAAFEAAAGRALATQGPERTTAMEAAARLWTGEPLPEERYSDWAAGWRERLNSLHADVLSALAESYGRAGDHAAAARAARALVDLDPLDETRPAAPDGRLRRGRATRRRPAPVPRVPPALWSRSSGSSPRPRPSPSSAASSPAPDPREDRVRAPRYSSRRWPRPARPSWFRSTSRTDRPLSTRSAPGGRPGWSSATSLPRSSAGWESPGVDPS